MIGEWLCKLGLHKWRDEPRKIIGYVENYERMTIATKTIVRQIPCCARCGIADPYFVRELAAHWIFIEEKEEG